MKLTISRAACCMALVLAGGPALAWGDLGHEVSALIAYDWLTSSAKAQVNALLQSDPDTLTAPDFASRATWADKYRNGHRETAPWHFVDIELSGPDLRSACFGFPALAPGQAASAGVSNDCVVDKIDQFGTELRSPATTPAERLLAFKFLLHFVGDLHQPLHASDDNDRGGNCIALSPSPDGRATNLHAYWDTGVVQTLGGSAPAIAASLSSRISPSDVAAWSRGDPRSWAMDSFRLATSDVYALPSRPTCSSPGSVSLSSAYQVQAQKDAALQLEKAGVRIALELNRAFAPIGVQHRP
jgi:hypothetical protein